MRLAAVVLTLAAGAHAHAATAAKWTVGPAPSWVDPIAAPSAATTDLTGQDTEYLLYERQIRRSNDLSRYKHIVIRVLTPHGVKEESQLEIDFEPYQRLVVHSIRVIRNGVAHDALRKARRETIQKENDLERQLLSGTLTAVIILDDVRVGDVIEYSYTIDGENPIFAGKYSGALDVGFEVPVRLVRHRVVWPASRTLRARGVGISLEPRVIERGAEREYIWERRNVAAIDRDDDAPPWNNPYPWIQLSEWGSWQEVRQWAAGLYDRSISSALRGQIEDWKQMPDVEERVAAALRFVQDDVRYLGIELGPNSHRPHPPSEVFDRRFGDCKDKAGLLVAILGSLGIEAHPALVATEYRQTAESHLPSPLVFDHVIVRATVSGHVVWLDATDSLQRGPVLDMAAPPFERALVLDDSAKDLERIPRWSPTKPGIAETETYTVRDYASPVDLVVTTEWRGPRADHMRHVLASESRDDLLKKYQNYYAAEMPRIEAVAPLDVFDDAFADVIQLTEHYRIPDFWKGTRHDFSFDLLVDDIRAPKTRLRAMPLWLRHPVDEQHTIRVKLPPGWHFENEHRYIEDKYMRFEIDTRQHGNDLELRRRLQTLADEVPAAEVARHLDVRNEMRNDLGFWIDRAGAVSSGDVGKTVVLGLIVTGCVGAVVVMVPRLRARARRRRLEKRVRHDAGETAATALTIRNEAELTKLRCSCGGSLSDAGGRDEIALGDQRIRIAQMVCAKCERRRSVYFKLMSR